MGNLEQDRIPPGIPLKTFDYGLWRVVYEDTAHKSKSWMHDVCARVRQIRDTPVLRFLREVYAIDTTGFILCVFSRCLSGIEQSLLVYYTTQILGLIEVGFTSGTVDRRAIFVALASRLGLSLFIVFWRRLTDHADAKLETQVRMYFQQRLLVAHSTNLQDHFDITNDSHMFSAAPPPAWRLLFGFLELVQSILSLFSQLLVLLALCRSREDGMAIFVICSAKPLYDLFFVEELFTRPYFAYVHDKVYERMSSMWKIAMDPYYAKEIVSYALTNFLVSEFEQARLKLRGVSERAPYSLSMHNAAFTEIAAELLGPLPLIYVATNTLVHSRSVALSSIVVINETSFALSSLFSSLSSGLSRFGRDLSDIKVLYARIDGCAAQLEARHQLLPYPPPEHSSSAGMGVEFRGVSFRYPGSQTSQYALKNVTFTIAPSSMVVIVGQNGSGKSSLAHLLTGLCQPTSGDILFDGTQSSLLRREDLSQAIAFLTQDHRVLPLSIGENIGLGDPAERHDTGRIREAAALGGAEGFIGKFSDGYEHSLAVLKTHFTSGEIPDGPLTEFANEFQKCTSISGGERQRLVAARMFMRLLSQNTKLVVADEPSAAIDPIGEHELFEKLREHQRGKTMVFISHRFGYLTKHADQILCMKDGQLVEAGTHAELMALDGEYRRLYDVQARAFRDDVSPLSSSP